jgi:hypothetical protein
VPYADFVTTTTHKTLRGPRGGLILCKEKYAAAINKAIFPGIQGGPLMHIIASKAVCLKEALTDEFKAYQKQIVKNAKALCDALISEGFDIVSGGTDNHLMLINLTKTGITGKEAEHMLDEVSITVNKNTILLRMDLKSTNKSRENIEFANSIKKRLENESIKINILADSKNNWNGELGSKSIRIEISDKCTISDAKKLLTAIVNLNH